ncbi:MAG TPA: hypothetical protein VGL78_15325 [Solirubrobacteraceae bacterium]
MTIFLTGFVTDGGSGLVTFLATCVTVLVTPETGELGVVPGTGELVVLGVLGELPPPPDGLPGVDPPGVG